MAAVTPETAGGAGGTERPRWYQLAPDEVAARLEVDPTQGLSAAEGERRRQQHGSNVLAAKKKESAAQAFLRQYRSPSRSGSTSPFPA
jgi:magnesium-transporting ATPase (P-type)